MYFQEAWGVDIGRSSQGALLDVLFYLLPAVPFMCLALATVVTSWVRSLGRRAIVPLSKQATEARQWFLDCFPPPGSLASNG